MHIGLKSISESFRSFLNTSGKYILFTSLLYSLWLVRTFVADHAFDLESFSGRMIGIATLEAYEVGTRVSMFYKSLLILFFSFAAFNLIGYFLAGKIGGLIGSVESKIINYSSVVGILFFLFQVFGYKTSDSMELVYFVHKLMFGAILLKLLFFRTSALSLYNYAIIILLSVSFYFFVAECSWLLGQSKNPDFLITSFVICCLLIITSGIIQKKESSAAHQARLDSTAYVLVPLGFLPFINFLKDEIYLVLLGKQIVLKDPLPIYCLLIVLLACWMLIRYKKRKQQGAISGKKLVTRSYFPIFIFSLITYVNYNHIINYSDEVFEAGNKYLPVMEYKLFGVIPTFEKFNSHLLSDYFFSAIYIFFNDFKGPELELYDFLYLSFAYLLYYYLIYFISRNPFIALFSILFFPLCAPMLPEPYAFGILGVFALHKIISQTQSFKNYLLFFITMAGLVFWRMDLGYACLIVMSVMLLYYHFFEKDFKINWGLLLKSAGTVLGMAALTFSFLSWYRGINLFKNLINTLNYLSSAQTYGFTGLGASDTVPFKMHYFIFPLLIGIILLALVIRFKDLNRSKAQRLAYLSLFFACGFYLVNFNRGLVRHSLVELVDHFTVSYLYLIVPCSIFVFYRRSSHISKFLIFCVLSFFILIHYKFPDPKGSKSYFEQCLEKIAGSKKTDLSKITDRLNGRPAGKEHYDHAFIEFIRKNTSANETFIDFTNNPMLYFYTRKITPSFFYQNPICSHNDFLQAVFIEGLKNYNVPFLLFSRNDQLSRDMVDRVPNTLRHYKIAEHLYQNYSPYILAGHLEVWKKNGSKNANYQNLLYSFHKIKTELKSDSVLHTDFKINPSKKYLMRVALEKKGPVDISVQSDKAPVPCNFEYVSDTLAYCTFEPKGNLCRISFQKQGIAEFQVAEYTYVPDFYQEKFSAYSLLKLPYIWGAYDKLLDQETVLFKKDVSVTLPQYKPYAFKLPDNVDKTTGNTLLLNCSNSTKIAKSLTLLLGAAGDKNRTTVTFDVLPSKKAQRYAIRISSIYKWYSDTINRAELITESEGIHISDIKLTKGL